MAYLKLLLIRHGQSLGNQEGRMEGWQSTPLSPLGQQQCLSLGQYLASQRWCPTHIYCSPLERATASLAVIQAGFRTGQGMTAAAPLAPVVYSPDLRESHQGIFTGLTWAQACDRYPQLCERLTTSLDWHPVPEAETPLQVQRRAQGWLQEILDRHGNGDQLWVISHQGLLFHLIAQLMGCDRTWGLAIPPTACFEFWLDHSRWQQTGPNRHNTELWRIQRFNDQSHRTMPY
jgi:2,3-bisphosphoglycerate-dependent phosphoglycerate mutase